MEATLQKITTIQLSPEELQQRKLAFIAGWKKRQAEGQAAFEAKCETPEYQAIFKKLRSENAKRGIVIAE